MKRIEVSFKVLGLLLCSLFLFLPIENQGIEFTLFIIILTFLGIPHGAIDHLTSEPILTKKGLIKFLFYYLSLIGLYLISWIYFPVFSLVIFILMSAYHFGQTHFIGRSNSNSSIIPLYISRGLYFLLLILGGNFSLTQSILEPIFDISILLPYLVYILMGALILTIAFQFLSRIKITILDIVELSLLGAVLFFSPLMISFIVYFGFWHALPSMISEYEYLKAYPNYNSIKKFTIQLLPFSLISLVGIALILIFGLKLLDQSELILLFFILISLISFPHIFYMDRFWRKVTKTDLS